MKFKNGEEVEVKDMGSWEKAIYIGFNRRNHKAPFVCVSGELNSVYCWAECRAIETLPEYTMEELIEKIGHNFKIKADV